MKPIISVQNLSKRYKLGVFNAKTLREEAEAFLARFSRRKAHTANGTRQTASGLVTSNSSPATAEPSSDFWALRDVSFDVQPGEVIGVIGRNGAGKSTLLKILSRITEPTSGEARIRGRVASLLEVGTGFHPELSGRENIFLNGAILGMSKAEIRSKFDEIVAFAEIEKFIDTPVKRYSSGMYVRLAFAVAAHLEPEILIVDEVLAVGDATFQRKCIGKMREVSGQDGRTVLFVSHMMTTLQALCDKAIFLEGGKTEGIESVHTAVSKYLHGEGGIETPECVLPPPAPDTEAVLERVRIIDSSGKPSIRLKTSEPWIVEMEWKNVAGVPVNPNIQLRNISGVVALIAVDANNDWDGSKKRARGHYKTSVQIPAHFLNGNEYWLSASLDCASPQRAYHGAQDAMRITLWDPMDESSIARGYFTKPREDAITWPALDWKSTGPHGEIR